MFGERLRAPHLSSRRLQQPLQPRNLCLGLAQRVASHGHLGVGSGRAGERACYRPGTTLSLLVNFDVEVKYIILLIL